MKLKEIDEGEKKIRGEEGYEISDDKEENIRISFGIERYYVKEGEGKKIEGRKREKDIKVIVEVDE